MIDMNDSEQRIRELAFKIWEWEGRLAGQAERHWASAKAIIEKEDAVRREVEGEPPGDSAEKTFADEAVLTSTNAP